jgi:hypothetical protein
VQRCNVSAGPGHSKLDLLHRRGVRPPKPLYMLNMGNGNQIIIETNTLQMEEGSHYKPLLMFASVDTKYSKFQFPEVTL